MQNGAAQLAVILFSGDMLAAVLTALSAADGASSALHTAPDAHLFFDSRLDFQNQVAIALGSHHVRLCHQRTVRLTQQICSAFLALHPRLIDSRLLISAHRLGVTDAGLADKQPRQLLQRLLVELLPLSVYLVVAQHHAEAVQLLLLKFPSGQAVDLLQLLLTQLHLPAQQVSRLAASHRFPSPFFSIACSICLACACSSWALACSTSSVMLTGFHFT